VQVLRGVASMLVLTGHVQARLIHSAAAVGLPVWTIPRFAGGFGVDLFFCISGFIMVVSSGRYFAAAAGWRHFLARRAIRLVPLYWFFTLAYLPVLLGGTHGFHGNLPAALATSFAFIPYPGGGIGETGVFPVYSLGWSLNFEMFFYVLFATFLTLPRPRAVGGVVVTLCLLVLAGLIFRPSDPILSVWTAPILLEFGFGLGLGIAWLGPVRLPRLVCLLLAFMAVALLVADPQHLLIKPPGGTTPNDMHRVLGWGIPAATLLLSACFLEKNSALGGVVIATLRRLGDASYSLYLVHPMVLLIFTRLWTVLCPAEWAPRLTSWAALGLLLAVGSIFAAVVTHRWIEKPMTRWLNDGLLRRTRAGAAPRLPLPFTPGLHLRQD